MIVVPERIPRISGRCRAPRAVALDIAKALTGFGLLVFFISSSLTTFEVGFLDLYHHLSLIDGFWSFWMEGLRKGNPLMMVLLNGFILGPKLFLSYN